MHPSLREPAHRVDPRAKTLWIVPLIVAAPVAIGALIAAAFSGEFWWIPILILAAGPGSRLLRRGGARVAVPIPSVGRCPPTPSIPSPAGSTDTP